MCLSFDTAPFSFIVHSLVIALQILFKIYANPNSFHLGYLLVRPR